LSAVAVRSTKKVFIVAPGGTAANGGIGRVVRHLARCVSESGAVAFEVVDTYGPAVNTGGAKRLMPFYFARALGRIAAACLTGEMLLAHIHMAANASIYRKAAVLVICRAFRVPVILHIHGGDLPIFFGRIGAAQRALLRRILRGSTEVIVLGERWRAYVASLLRLSPERITVLPNGVPVPPEVPARSPGRCCELLFLGAVIEPKGVDELLEALARLPLSSPMAEWRLQVAGEGDLARYRRLAEALGIADRVIFLAWVDEERVQQLLRSSDVLVLPSHFEGLSMAVLEAMSYGLAIVTTPVGATEEAIIGGDTGLLVPVGDVEQLAGAIARLIADPSLRLRLGEAARARFRASFALDVFERRISGLYRKYSAPYLRRPEEG
jgi:glycosyltransferase involved in cell wall biosynthesis